MKDKKTILIALVIVLFNIIVGNLFAPYGILFIPLVLTSVSFVICMSTNNLKPISKSMILFLLISLNDIGIKLYSGGRHDSEGLAWVNGFLFIGLVPSFIILLFSIIKNKEDNLFDKVVAIFLFVFLIGIHTLIFKDLGLGRYYWYEWNNTIKQ